MTRIEMIQKLGKIDFEILWPDGPIDDLVEFTEHPLWLNKLGYGYFACDESNVIKVTESVPSDEWKMIRNKLSQGTISYSDIEETTLVNIFEYEEEFTPDEYVKLLELPEELGDYIYYYWSSDGRLLFGDERSSLNCFRRDYCDVKWESLKDEELKVWIDYIADNSFDSVYEYM